MNEIEQALHKAIEAGEADAHLVLADYYEEAGMHDESFVAKSLGVSWSWSRSWSWS